MQNKILNHIRLILSIAGFSPEENDRYPNYCRFKGFVLSTFPCLAIIFMFIPASRWSSNPLFLSECILDAITLFMVALKSVTYTFFRQKIIRMITYIRNRLEEKRSLKEQQIFKVWQTYETRFAKFLVLSYFLSLIIHTSTLLVQEERTLPIVRDYFEYLLESPWYEMIYVLQITLGLFICSAMVACDLFGIFFIFYLSYEMKCTALLMRKIGKRKNNLKKIIERYRDAYNYGKNVCSLLSVIFYVEIIFYSFGVCIAATVLLKTTVPSIAFKMIILLICLIGHQSIACFLGEMITTANINVTTAIHQSYWYNLHNKKDLKSLHILLLRDQKPLRLVVGTTCFVNLKILLDSILWVCSYIIVLYKLISNNYTN